MKSIVHAGPTKRRKLDHKTAENIMPKPVQTSDKENAGNKKQITQKKSRSKSAKRVSPTKSHSKPRTSTSKGKALGAKKSNKENEHKPGVLRIETSMLTLGEKKAEVNQRVSNMIEIVPWTGSMMDKKP